MQKKERKIRPRTDITFILLNYMIITKRSGWKDDSIKPAKVNSCPQPERETMRPIPFQRHQSNHKKSSGRTFYPNKNSILSGGRLNLHTVARPFALISVTPAFWRSPGSKPDKADAGNWK